MSLSIPCPHCGERPVNEFIYGEIPHVPDDITGEEARDFDFVFMRNNPQGVQHEAWFHVYGCRRWTYLHRDTVKDEVVKHDLE
ncbi:MAG UNVERIFIED_CONTAM: sarcosine oxidase subunit delta [Anaerolineae bacterium]|jgi:heterotetrameric sarcosine oxidase delta subunit